MENWISEQGSVIVEMKANITVLKESLLDLKEIKELLWDNKRSDRISEGGEKFVNDEGKKAQDVEEGSATKNHTHWSEEKTKNEVRLARETKMMIQEGDASIKRVKTVL